MRKELLIMTTRKELEKDIVKKFNCSGLEKNLGRLDKYREGVIANPEKSGQIILNF